MVKLISHITTGNVFEDLGFSPEDAASLARKTDLMLELDRIVKRRRLSPERAAACFGVSKPVVARLKRGDLEFFSADMLMQMLERAGKQVKVVVTTKKRVRAA